MKGGMDHASRGSAHGGRAAVAAPLTPGMSGIAAADSFSHHSDSAGPHGASTSNVQSSTNGGSGAGSNGLIGDLVGGLL